MTRTTTSSTTTLIVVERQIITLIEPYLTDGKITLAGSGVGCFDMQVIRAQMPELAQRLNYYVIDVGVVRRWLRDVCQVPVSDLGPVNHRALDDVQHHLAEARLYKNGAAPMWSNLDRAFARVDL
jgi:oligoribonuclease (3'-5' exoribonuclease)